MSFVYGISQIYFAEKVLKKKNNLLKQMTNKLEKCRYKYFIASNVVISRYLSSEIMQKQIKISGKGDKERYIPVIPELEATLKEYLRLREEVANKKSEDFLFLVKNGKKIYPTLVYRIINSYFSAVTSKKDVSPHILRHSFASHLLDNGADLNTVKELLGHSSLASTQVYTNTSLVELKRQYKKAHPRANNSENEVETEK